MESSIKPAIVVVAYNRAKSLERLLGYIGKATYNYNDIPLVISIDYKSDNGDVINCAQKFEWKYGNKVIRTHEHNLGLKNHIIECGNLSNDYGAVIILEDDVIVAPNFYEYVIQCQEHYSNDDRIAGVALYSHRENGYAQRLFTPVTNGYDVYFGQFGITWGQSWTSRQWDQFRDWLIKNPNVDEVPDNTMPHRIFQYRKAWSKHHIKYIIESNKFWAIPYEAMSSVYCDNGVHSAGKRNTSVQVSMNRGYRKYNFPKFEDGIKYDIFFENLDVFEYVSKIVDSRDVCIDLNEIPTEERDILSNKYVLTTRKLNYEIVDSYALELRPIEINVLENIKGNGIFLYNTSQITRNNKYSILNRLEYELGWAKPRAAAFYSIIFGLIYK